MNLAAARTALDLLLCLRESLHPCPTAISITRCARKNSNQTRFRGSLTHHLTRLGAKGALCRDGEVAKDDRVRFSDWLRLLLEKLPRTFRKQNARRLEQLPLIYRLAYGGIFDDVSAVANLDQECTELQAERLLADCIGEDLLFHSGLHGLEDTTELIPLVELTQSRVNHLLDEAFPSDAAGDKTRFLMLRSGCLMEDGRTMHIPMLDFRVTSAEDNTRVVAACLQAATVGPGIILDSGKSYHYYGFHLQSGQELLEFVHKSLLLIPLVDARYLAHCLLDKEQCLRCSGRTRHGRAPTIRRLLEIP